MANDDKPEGPASDASVRDAEEGTPSEPQASPPDSGAAPAMEASAPAEPAATALVENSAPSPASRTDASVENGEPGTPPVAVDDGDQPAPKPEVPVDQAPEDDSPDAHLAAPSALAKVPPALFVAAAAILFLFFLPSLSRAGLWDPFELNVAELARRIAINLHGASNLSLAGADNSLPHLNDLGRPQLPFTAMALGFKLFGLRETAGRAPLALFGVIGVLCTYNFVARLVDKRAGVFAAIALLTMPLYFVQARTMLGDITTFAALAASFGGLAVAVFDRKEATVARLANLAVGLLGLFAGYESRGVLIGLVVPLLAIGLAWLLVATQGYRRDALAHGVGAGSLVAGVVLLTLGLRAGHAPTGELSLWLGAIPRTQPKYPTFDYFVGHIGHAVAPWSAFVPFALGRLFVTPQGQRGEAADRDSQLRVALLLGATIAVSMHGWLASYTDLIPFSGCALFAAACGIALRDYERGAHPSLAVGLGTAVFLGLFHHDFHQFPEKAFQAYGIATANFPEGFKDESYKYWTIALVGMAGVALLVWLEAPRSRGADGAKGASREPFDPAHYLKVFRALRDDWDGNGAIVYYAIVLGSSLAGLLVFVGSWRGWKWAAAMAPLVKKGVLNAWWVSAIAPFAIVFGIIFAADTMLWVFERAEPLSGKSILRGRFVFDGAFERLLTARKRSIVRGEAAATSDGTAPYRTAEAGADEEVPFPQDPERVATAAFILPFLVVAIPVVVGLGLKLSGKSALVAAALAIPSGVVTFLALGFLGDLLRGSRAAFYTVAAFGAATALGFGFYPGLANQLSPKEIFETYARVHASNEELALLGVSARTAAYYASGSPKKFGDAQQGFDWLSAAPSGERRFLATRAEDLPRLNFLYRRGNPSAPANLPVLDGRSSQIILTASQLLAGEKNQNPLEAIVLNAAPKPQRALNVNLEDRLQVLGYDLTDMAGRPVEWITAGQKYRMRAYYKVLASVPSEWEGFIHIDGYRKRHNGDHKVCNGKYPFSFWLPGDVIVDDHEFALEQNFTAGEYNLWFGFWVGDSRMKVKSGSHDDNRINGGTIKVR
jgi:4-amino-4-deoxy-L-arabinose transferase-like glycosyltransferase